MLKMRKFAAALVLGLIMCLALFTTGAFAQTAWGGSSATAVAVASSGFDGCGCDGFGFGGFPFGFGGFPFGFGGFGGFGSSAFAVASAFAN